MFPHLWMSSLQVPLEEGLNKTIHYFRKELEYQANNQYIPKPKPARIKKSRMRHSWTLHYKKSRIAWWFTRCNFCSASPICSFSKRKKIDFWEGIMKKQKLEFPYKACFKGMDVPNNIENCRYCLALFKICLSMYISVGYTEVSIFLYLALTVFDDCLWTGQPCCRW